MPHSEAHAQFIADILSHQRGDVSEQFSLSAYVDDYFRDVDFDDLSNRDPAEWYGAALSHLRLAQRRLPGKPAVRVYNPQFDQDGWQSTHTVIELVNDDRPFLVDTISLTIGRLGYVSHLLIHPVLNVLRNDSGQLSSLLVDAAPAESWMHLEIDRVSDDAKLEEIENELHKALAELQACIEDWPAMASQLQALIQQLRSEPQPDMDPESFSETLAYLDWLLADNFIFLGYRDYSLADDSLEIVAGSGLGILRERGDKQQSQSFAALPDEVKARARDKTLLTLTKTNSRATIHRAAYLDCIGIKRFDSEGRVCGERRFLGLYTSNAYNTPPQQIPLLRQKINHVLSSSHFQPHSHKAKTLLNVLQTFPRDELIEILAPALLRTAQSIVNLQERSRVRVFIREDSFRRYVSVLVYCPRDSYNTDVRVKMQQILLDTFSGSTAEFNVMLSESVLARIHFMIRIPTGANLQYEAADLEKRIANATRRWSDDLQLNLIQHAGEERGTTLFTRYHKAFPAAYFADYDPRTAVSDIEKLEGSLASDRIMMKLSNTNLADPLTYRFKIFRERPIALSDSLPVLENMGVRVIDEQPYTLHFPDCVSNHCSGWITDIGIRLPQMALLDDETSRQHFQAGFAHIFDGHAENDSFNRLILQAGLEWRQVSVLRAYSRYLKQVGLNISQDGIADCLVRYARIAALLVRLFLLQQDPEQAGEAEREGVDSELHEAVRAVPSLDDERVLSGLLGAIRATLRTNYFQVSDEGPHKPYLSFKVESAKVPHMPQPVPLYEIFVYSPRVEGIHLRGGKVARGGLRWSDRREDFRTEVLGLVKAQMVKNTVIVPVGSKGGFVVKQPPAGREAYQAEGIACYQTFIRGLLDLTDNLVNGALTPPPQTHRRDGDDPYLVVAADKGTATFSDIANAVSQEYAFWLDDAFASGGSVGYDHKKMGITARGAWESVKRHFREMGIDTQQQAFTVVGIGDLMGDVFGNGMLRSPQTRLVAAFNHQHIFLDPAPDASLSFQERERIFALPRSSWDDYNRDLISTGGGIWLRSAKTIPLSPEVQALLGIGAEQLPPNDLIRAILQAPVDLLYNGGIGTYVKASTQSHSEANDRGNDVLRINGNELRAKVVAEGGNLGFTQLGRIEYALAGGRIYTDAIDNSAGVDCSDHEVNIKILLGRLIQAGDMTLKQRNILLASMTDSVGELVLEDNYQQSEAISLERRQAVSLLSVHARLMQALEKAGKLSRRIEYLPTDTVLQERSKQGLALTSPELAVLLAYAKIVLYQDLLASKTIDASEWDVLLSGYFPPALTAQFAGQLAQHPLRREIVANELTNSCVNRMGMTFVYRVAEETNARPDEIVRAWYLAGRLMQVDALWRDVQEIDNRLASDVQYDMLLEVRKQVERVTRWVLRLLTVDTDASDKLQQLTAQIPALLTKLPQWLANNQDYCRQRDRYLAAGSPTDIADAVASLDAILSLLNIARIASEDSATVDDVACIHFQLDEALQLGWLRNAIEKLPRDNRWQALARMAFRDELYREHSQLTSRVLRYRAEQAASERVAAWLGEREEQIGHVARMFDELAALHPDLAMLSAGMREIRNRLAA